MPSLRALAARHPRAADACLAVVVTIVCGIALKSRESFTGPAALSDVVANVVMPVLLIWRRRSPLLMFWLAVAVAWAFDFLGSETAASIFVPLIALYTVARHKPRRYLWPALIALELSFISNIFLMRMRWEDTIGATAVVAAVTLLGMNLRTRSLYLAALEERARRLERERDSQAQLAVSQERSRIAREMHDIVAHNLAVIVALADGAALMTPTDPVRGTEAMAQVSATGRQALTEMRRLVGLLRDNDSPGGREPQPGFADIPRLVAQVRSAGLQVSLTQSGVPGEWGQGAGLAVYRIVQEALTNTLKHAGTQATAWVSLAFRPDGATVDITDDGAGKVATLSLETQRHGIAGMAERAAPFQGHVTVGPRAGPGWHVHATLSFQEGE